VLPYTLVLVENVDSMGLNESERLALESFRCLCSHLIAEHGDECCEIGDIGPIDRHTGIPDATICECKEAHLTVAFKAGRQFEEKRISSELLTAIDEANREIKP
jgi:hypothetical protein